MLKKGHSDNHQPTLTGYGLTTGLNYKLAGLYAYFKSLMFGYNSIRPRLTLLVWVLIVNNETFVLLTIKSLSLLDLYAQQHINYNS